MPKAEVGVGLFPPEPNADIELEDPNADTAGAGVPNADGVLVDGELLCASAPKAEGVPNAEVAVDGAPNADVAAGAGVPNPV